jgi:predicted transcriptional regulator
MAEKPARVAVLAIHPRFARAILKGEKRVELRRSSFRDPISHVVVYATAPVKKVVGWFEVGAIDRASPKAIWEAHGKDAGITRQEFRAYYQGAAGGTAILVKRTSALRDPQPLWAIGARRPPQSFIYLERPNFLRLRRRATSRHPSF